mgnify:CR=1 FL=1
MPIVATDIQFKTSTATGNLGGAIAGDDVSSALHGLFDVVAGAEALSGDAEYRCVYVKNNHSTLTLYNAVAFISSNTPSGDTAVDIGVGTSAVNGVEQTIANENTAPAGVSFSNPSAYIGGLQLGDIPAGQHRAIWIRRTVSAGAAAYSGDGMTLAVQGDTAA